ncbi:MAG TPA: Rv3235 family protein [Pilimelia sp.]|nr:Rv3235 family protein [Pilimelia sp.]
MPDGRVAAGRFVTRCVEILNGFRPVEHARPMVDGARERAVLAQLAIGRQRVADLLEGARPGPVPDPRRPRGAARALPVTLLRLHAGEPAPGALEAAAVLRTADRAWALAFRLEYRGGGWRCTAAWTL